MGDNSRVRRLRTFRSLAGNRPLLRVVAAYALFIVTEYSVWLAMLRVPVRPSPERAPAVLGDLRDSLRLIAGRPRLRLMVGLLTADAIVVGALDLLIVILAITVLDRPRAWAGYLNFACGVGAVQLPAPAIEGLAAALTPVELPAGAVLIRQGEPGDAYYAIATGELDIEKDGHFLFRCGRGDGVGEIALLRDVPRTATVTARTPATVYRLDREPFLAAVLGHAPTRHQAARIADGRLATDAPARNNTPGAGPAEPG